MTDDKLHKLVNGRGVAVVRNGEEDRILKEFHGGELGGHSGVNKTIVAVKIRYWWPGFTDDIKAYVSKT